MNKYNNKMTNRKNKENKKEKNKDKKKKEKKNSMRRIKGNNNNSNNNNNDNKGIYRGRPQSLKSAFHEGHLIWRLCLREILIKGALSFSAKTGEMFLHLLFLEASCKDFSFSVHFFRDDAAWGCFRFNLRFRPLPWRRF